MAVHGYKLPRTLLLFPALAPGLQDARVKTHFSVSRLFSQPAHSGSSRNHRSLNRLFRFAHELTDKVPNSIAVLCQSDVPADLSFFSASEPA